MKNNTLTLSVAMNDTVITNADITADQFAAIMAIVAGVKPTTTPAKTKANTPYVYDKGDIQPKWDIEKVDAVLEDGSTKALYRIKHAFVVNRSQKAAMSAAVKALPKVKSGKVTYTGKDGREHSYTAYGYATKDAAEKALETLPETIPADTIATFVKH